MVRVQRVLPVSERRACQVLGQPRSTQRYRGLVPDDEAALTAAIVRLAARFGRYGYRRIKALLRAEGWTVNHKRVGGSGARRGSRCPAANPAGGACGSPTDHASACGRRIATMSGPTT